MATKTVTKASKSKMSKAERLAALREKMKKTDTGGGGKGFWSPKQGRSVIRILPETGDMEFIFQEVGRHTFPDGRKVYCPKFTSAGALECPICELVDELYADGAPSSVRLAKSIKLRRAYWMNVINRDDQDSGPLIFTPGVKIFNQVQNLVGDPDYGDISDPEDGLDIVIIRTGAGGLDTDYDVKPRRNSSPLSDNEEEAKGWLEKSKDLSYVEVSEDPEEDSELSRGHAVYVLPYDRIVSEFGIEDLDVDELSSQVEASNDDEDTDRSSHSKKAKAVVKGKTPVKDVDEDEKGEEDNTDDDEVEKEVNRRTARRSRRR